MGRSFRAISRALVVSVLAATVLVVASAPAGACSCAVVDPPTALAEADGAFVGTLIERGDPEPEGGVVSSGEIVPWRFEVEVAVKGALGDQVVVHSAWSGASCGLEIREGQRAALLLDRRRDEWRSSLCLQLSPAELLRAAGLPAPDPTLAFTGPSGGPVGMLPVALVGMLLAGLAAALGARRRAGAR